MKKLLLVLTVFMFVFTLASCQREEKTLTVMFVPSRDSQKILDATEPLKRMLKEELSAAGYDFDEIVIEVGTSYEAAGEAMNAGTADIGFLPGGTYVLYAEDGNINVALTATRAGLSKDYPDAVDWNDDMATEGDSESQVTYYRGLIIAGTSAKARAISTKVNNEETITWEDMNDLQWCVRSASSSSGYIYPTLWLMENFDGKKITDLDNVTTTGGYGESMAALASGNCDVATFYADARRTYEDTWVGDSTDADNPGYDREDTIWAETDVIGVTDKIYNDTISVSTITVDQDLLEAIQQAFINIAATDDGALVLAIYSHEGYVEALDADYDTERDAQEALGD